MGQRQNGLGLVKTMDIGESGDVDRLAGHRNAAVLAGKTHNTAVYRLAVGQVIDAGQAVCRAAHGIQRQHGLFSGHYVIAHVHHMAERAVFQPVGQQSLQQTIFFYETRIVQVDTQQIQRNDGLGDALGRRNTPGGEAAVFQLQSGQSGQTCINGGLHLGFFPEIRQSLQGHGGGIRIGYRAGQRPAAVVQLLVQQVLEINSLCCIVAAAVFQQQDAEDRAHHRGAAYIIGIFCQRQQIMTTHVGQVLIQCQQCHRKAQIAGGRPGQLTVAGIQRTLRHGQPRRIIAVWHQNARPSQHKNRPVAVGVACRGHFGLPVKELCRLIPVGLTGRDRQCGKYHGSTQQNSKNSMEMFHKHPPKKKIVRWPKPPDERVCFKFRPKQVQRSLRIWLSCSQQHHSDRLAGLLTRFRMPPEAAGTHIFNNVISITAFSGNVKVIPPLLRGVPPVRRRDSGHQSTELGSRRDPNRRRSAGRTRRDKPRSTARGR